MTGNFLARGWACFEHHVKVMEWAQSVKDAAMDTLGDPQHSEWFRHENTWFVGVNALTNDPNGKVGAGPDLNAPALDIATQIYGKIPLDQGQVSVTFPGYPLRDVNESDAAHRFRKLRDAAHVDGLHARGRDHRRFLNEPHAYILGFPLGTSRHAPLVVWENSHEVMRSAFRTAFQGLDPSKWAEVDLTDIYKAARRKVFETCKRIELPVSAGQATLVHRLAVHGVAPWGKGGQGENRAIIYFRPALPGGAQDWLDLP